MDFADSHKTKGKTAIACIGTMQSMVDFSSLCVNPQFGTNSFLERGLPDLEFFRHLPITERGSLFQNRDPILE
jgi:hypothetical protein